MPTTAVNLGLRGSSPGPAADRWIKAGPAAAQLELTDVRIADGVDQLETITDDMVEAVASILVIENYRHKAKPEGRP